MNSLIASIFDNPLLRIRLHRATAYTWGGFSWMLLFSACIFISLFQLGQVLEFRHFINVLPPSLQPLHSKALFAQKMPFLKALSILIIGGFIVGCAIDMLYRILREFFSAYPDYRGAADVDLRALPISKAQFIVAQHDWPFIVDITLIIVVSLLALLPSSIPTPPWILYVLPGSAALFALHRCVIWYRYNRSLFLRSRRLLAWLVYVTLLISWIAQLYWIGAPYLDGTLPKLIFASSFLLFLYCLPIPPSVLAEPER